ncbi:hypothetical protein BDA96_07G005100 [Sorghum bicolor]|uniref:Uncharacterized protein n=2 Tax=Sorghum bicolor TaxID=4558 RepID=A0A921U8A1_SORBI|nr:hypothetical protein BDA96_07G005100 [Sorghum bicolor]OQU79759.1 hypothetical protein SORBI_3007G004850 [Sorghum bicolor]
MRCLSPTTPCTQSSSDPCSTPSLSDPTSVTSVNPCPHGGGLLHNPVGENPHNGLCRAHGWSKLHFCSSILLSPLLPVDLQRFLAWSRAICCHLVGGGTELVQGPYQMVPKFMMGALAL